MSAILKTMLNKFSAIWQIVPFLIQQKEEVKSQVQDLMKTKTIISNSCAKEYNYIRVNFSANHL